MSTLVIVLKALEKEKPNGIFAHIFALWLSQVKFIK